MAGIAFDSCGMCLGPADKTKNCFKDSVNYLWSYLYHRNVRESVQVVVEDSLAKLTFSLSVEGGVEERNEGSEGVRVIICVDCCEELEKLDKLHHELEAIKKALESQVGKIDERRKNQDDSYLSSCVPKLQLSMAGSVVGKQNISQALQFLGNLTDDGIPCASRFSSNPSIGIFGTEPDETGTLLHQQLGQDATTAEEFLDPLELDPANMKVEMEDIKIITTPVPNNQLNDFELEELSVPIAATTRAETDESSVILDPLGLTTSDKEQDPLACPPEDMSTGDYPLHFILGSPKSPKLSTGKRSSSKISGRRITKNLGRQKMKSNSKGAKCFKCEICNKTFSKNFNLLRHQRSHTASDKPFLCDICQQGFSRNLNLQKHMRRCQ